MGGIETHKDKQNDICQNMSHPAAKPHLRRISAILFCCAAVMMFAAQDIGSTSPHDGSVAAATHLEPNAEKAGLSVLAQDFADETNMVWPKFTELTSATKVASNSGCAKILHAKIDGTTFGFEPYQSELDPEYFGKLVQLANAVEKCPHVSINVQGYAAGDASDAEQLGYDRAASVIRILRNKGFETRRYHAAGFGLNDFSAELAEQSIAPSTMALNNRVELVSSIGK